MKNCSHCKVIKPSVSFCKDKASPDGLRRYCKECVKTLFAERDKVRRRTVARSPLNAQAKERDKIRKLKEYYDDPAKSHVRTIKRRATSKLAQPEWSNKDAMADTYRMARELSQITGTQWHVDHIVPLQSKNVCGLHNHFNLRVITASENLQKGNRIWPDMPA